MKILDRIKSKFSKKPKEYIPQFNEDDRIDEIQKMFPDGFLTLKRIGYEVSGLNKYTNPINCEIIEKRQDSYGFARREYMVVKAEKFSYYLRVCTAGSDSGYDEFAVIYNWMENDSPDHWEWYMKHLNKLDWV